MFIAFYKEKWVLNCLIEYLLFQNNFNFYIYIGNVTFRTELVNYLMALCLLDYWTGYNVIIIVCANTDR
jgi:hypothetical protein